MAKKPSNRSGPVDIFADGNLNQAQGMLADATDPPQASKPLEAKPPHIPRPVEQRPTRVTTAPAAVVRRAEEEARPPIAREHAQDPETAAVEPTNVHLKFRVRQSTRARFDGFRAELSAALGGARLTDSNIGRALIDWVLFDLGDDIIEAAREASGSLRRPPADDPAAMAEFDEALRGIVRRGVLRRGERAASEAVALPPRGG